MWTGFVSLADEFLVAYSVPPLLVPVKLFEIGHALELYLKACHISRSGDVDAAMRLGHRIPELWRACKSLDSAFMPNHRLRDDILAAPIFQANPQHGLATADYLEFLEHQELYLVARLLPDLKYLGTRLRTIKGQTGFGFVYPNDSWIPFFAELRRFLKYPDGKQLDMIEHHLESGKLPAQSVRFLSGILGR
jgi:hypothetical protein